MKHFLLFSVFIIGFCVLTVELIATRIISPYFGNTVYTFSAIITTILSALSIGYFIGGKISDKYPSNKLFYFLIFLAGICILTIHLIKQFALPLIALKTADPIGALYTSLILFFLPAFVLGTISPFAVKLSALNMAKEKIGTIAGTIFFWSTFGSILGSLASGYILIPNFGTNMIVTGVGLILVSLGMIGLLLYQVNLKYLRIAAFIFLTLLTLSNLFTTKKGNYLYQKDGLYEKILIVDGVYKQKKTRFIIQDQNYSGAMYINSTDLVYEYTKYYEIYKYIKPDIKHALVLGGSASYSIPKALLNEDNDIEVDVVDIEPEFPNLAKKFFKLPDSKRLKTYIIDGRKYLNLSNKKYDLILSDAYHNLNSVPMHLTTLEFFRIIYKNLNEEGVFIANFIGSLSQKAPSLLLSEMKTLNTVFPNSYLFAVESVNSREIQNFILIAVKSDKKIDFTLNEFKKDPFLKDVKMHLVSIPDTSLNNQIIFTDDYAPVEFLTAQVL